jgi:hypothetical protein
MKTFGGVRAAGFGMAGGQRVCVGPAEEVKAGRVSGAVVKMFDEKKDRNGKGTAWGISFVAET